MLPYDMLFCSTADYGAVFCPFCCLSSCFCSCGKISKFRILRLYTKYAKFCTIQKFSLYTILKLFPTASTLNSKRWKIHTHTLSLTTSPSNIGWQKHARLGPGKHSREVLRLPREGAVSRLKEYSATVGDRYGGWAGLVHVDAHELYTSETKAALFPDLPTIQVLIRGGGGGIVFFCVYSSSEVLSLCKQSLLLIAQDKNTWVKFFFSVGDALLRLCPPR